MENGSQALLLGAAVLIFIVALSITFSTLGQAKSTADIVLFFSDRDNFQTLLEPDRSERNDGGRTVSVDTVIATISKCSKEKFTVTIKTKENFAGKTYKFEYDVDTEKEIKDKVELFIKKHLGNEEKYRETYVETTTGGRTITEPYTYITNGQSITASDGTVLEQDVAKKIYITYTLIN